MNTNNSNHTNSTVNLNSEKAMFNKNACVACGPIVCLLWIREPCPRVLNLMNGARHKASEVLWRCLKTKDRPKIELSDQPVCQLKPNLHTRLTCIGQTMEVEY